MRFRMIFKNGESFIVEADDLDLTRDRLTREVTNVTFVGCTENLPVYFRFEDVLAVVLVNPVEREVVTFDNMKNDILSTLKIDLPACCVTIPHESEPAIDISKNIGKIMVHHIDPITLEDVIEGNPKVFDLNNLTMIEDAKDYRGRI